jgi:hypothetical protein
MTPPTAPFQLLVVLPTARGVHQGTLASQMDFLLNAPREPSAAEGSFIAPPAIQAIIHLLRRLRASDVPRGVRAPTPISPRLHARLVFFPTLDRTIAPPALREHFLAVTALHVFLARLAVLALAMLLQSPHLAWQEVFLVPVQPNALHAWQDCTLSRELASAARVRRATTAKWD